MELQLTADWLLAWWCRSADCRLLQSFLWDCGLVWTDSSDRGDSVQEHKAQNISRVPTGQPGNPHPHSTPPLSEAPPPGRGLTNIII